MKFVIALHDIGKPLAVRAGDKRRQHEFTLPILKKALADYGFSEAESKLAHALVDHDVVGNFVKRRIDAIAARAALNEIANGAGLALADFIPIQLLFYTVDASSYPSLRQAIFTMTEDGLIVPRAVRYDELRSITAGASVKF